MKLGVFAMITQLNAKVLNGSHQHHQKEKRSSSKVKSEEILLCFYDSKGIFHHEFVPEGQTVTGSFCLCSGTPMEEDLACPTEYSAPGSWFLLHTNSPVHRAVAL